MALNKTDSKELNPAVPGNHTTAAEAFAAEKGGKPKRTTGLKLFDVFLYPVLTNFGVFAISVIATYLTSHGNEMGGRFGLFFYNRGTWFKNKAEKAGLSEDQADMAKMVFFSFADGSLLAPLVKGLEDRREKIAKRIDGFLGTKPKDESVYASEPKQGWFSVLSGRFATAAIVVPTAVVLDKAGLNKKLFSDPGLKMGHAFVEKFPRIAEKFRRFDLPGLFKVGLFEAFYTSVCTGGLYVSSRFIARKTDKGDDVDKAGDPLATEQHNPKLKHEPQAQRTELIEPARNAEKQLSPPAQADWRSRIVKEEKKGLALTS